MPVNRRITRLIAAAACLALTLTLFAVPQVRAAALNWVTIFRVQESRVLHFTPKDWESLMQKENPNLEASPLARAMENLIHVETVRSPIHTAGLTLDDLLVQGMARPTHIPEGFTPRDGGTVSTGERLIRVNVKEVNRILAQFGRPERLPDALEGQVVRVAHGAAKRMTYTNNGELLILSEMSMPEVSASGRVDINQVIQVLSGILGNEFGISGALQSQLAQFDMSKTVPLPLVEGKGTEVKVKSWKATYLEDQGWGAVVWMAEGVVRMVEGKLPKDELLRIATGWGD